MGSDCSRSLPLLTCYFHILIFSESRMGRVDFSKSPGQSTSPLHTVRNRNNNQVTIRMFSKSAYC